MFSRKRENSQKHDGFANKVMKSVRRACLVEKKVMMTTTTPTTSSQLSDFDTSFKPVRTRVEEPEKLGIKSSTKLGSLKRMKQAIISPFLFFANKGKPKNTGKGKPLEAEPGEASRDDEYSLDSWEPLNFVTNNASQNYRGFQFWADDMDDDDHQSGVCSPPLWKNSPPGSLARPCHHHHRSSRAEAIARGQWELMEMVKNMPESCYELSLKDLVLECEEESLIISTTQAAVVVEKVKNMARSGRMDNRGVFLKMIIFPITLGGLGFRV